MNRISTDSYPQSFEDALSRVAAGEPVIIEYQGEDRAALISLEALRLLELSIEQEEDRLDLEEAQKIMAQTKKEEWIPWEQAEAELDAIQD